MSKLPQGVRIEKAYSTNEEKSSPNNKSGLPQSTPFFEIEGITFTKKEKDQISGFQGRGVMSTKELSSMAPAPHLKRAMGGHSIEKSQAPVRLESKPLSFGNDQESSERFLFSRHSGETSRFEGPTGDHRERSTAS